MIVAAVENGILGRGPLFKQWTILARVMESGLLERAFLMARQACIMVLQDKSRNASM